MIAIPNMEKPKNCGMCQLADKWADDNDNVTIECLIGHTFNDCPLIDIATCGECIYHDDGLCHRPKWAMGVEPTDFCSYGERRADET